MKKTGEFLVSLVITPIGTVFTLVLIVIFGLGVLQGILAEAFSFCMNLFNGKRTKTNLNLEETISYLKGERRAV